MLPAHSRVAPGRALCGMTSCLPQEGAALAPTHHAERFGLPHAVSRVVFDAWASFMGFMNSLDEVVDEDMGLVSSCWSHADAIGWLPLARL